MALAEVAYPTNLDWSQKVKQDLPVRDQGTCGACWAFATAGSIGYIMLTSKAYPFDIFIVLKV